MTQSIKHNPESLVAIEPIDPAIVGGYAVDQVVIRDGLYSRKSTAAEASILEECLISHPSRQSIADYQVWVEQYWKTSQGTYSSVKRFSDKLDEEFQEVIIELANDNPDTEQLNSELGDVTWCLIALATNGGVDIDSGLKNRLYRYVAGTQWIVGTLPTEPTWRLKAAELATKFEPVSIEEIDQLIREGFEPMPSPVMNIYDPGDTEYDEAGHLSNLLVSLSAVKIIARNQYGRGYGDEPDEIVMDQKFKDLAYELGEISANALLEVAFMASRFRGITLCEIISYNVQKLKQRVINNQVDKTDSPRQ